MSTRLRKRRQRARRPALCASKQKLFTCNGRPWKIPKSMVVEYIVRYHPPLPPDTVIRLTADMIRSKASLYWYCNVDRPEGQLQIGASFNPTKCTWTIDSSFIRIHPKVYKTKEGKCAESEGPPRSARAFTPGDSNPVKDVEITIVYD